jgi:ATP-dependent DNA helicase RecQ
LQDLVQHRRMIDASDALDAHKRVCATKLEAMLGLCETTECRRVRLLNYFGEASAPCGNCDNCLDPPKVWDGTVAAQKLLSCVYRLWNERQQRFGAGHIISVLRGQTTEKVKQWRHETLSVYGVGADLSEQEWRTVIRQLIALDVLTVDHEAYGTLALTDASRAVLKGERKVMLRAQAAKRGKAERSSRERVAAAEGLSESARELFERLRAWRADAAKQHGVPAYVIFHDATLRTIAELRPRTLDQLREISGVGAKKLQDYGERILRETTGDAVEA